MQSGDTVAGVEDIALPRTDASGNEIGTISAHVHRQPEKHIYKGPALPTNDRNRPALGSLPIGMYVNGEMLAVGTAFLARRRKALYLVTNRHNLSGRDTNSNQPMHFSAAVPDSVRILQHAVSEGLSWIVTEKRLYDDDGLPLWFEHPQLGRLVDVVALPISQGNFFAFPYLIKESVVPSINLGAPVSVIGFRNGLADKASMFGRWVDGVVVETQTDNELPRFLIKSPAITGNSGSPVISNHQETVIYEYKGVARVHDRPLESLLGVYSGRVDANSNLGYVWNAAVIRDITDGRRRNAETGSLNK